MSRVASGLDEPDDEPRRFTPEPKGCVASYIHPGDRMGVLLEVRCDSEFIARTDDFKALVHEIALHIAAANPRFVRREDVPPDAARSEESYEELCLMEQPFIKNPELTVQQLIDNTERRLGEKLWVTRFARFKLGDAEEKG